jgi:hypothetical protein
MMDVCGGYINLLPYSMVQETDVINLWPSSEEDEQDKRICPLRKAQDKMPNPEYLPTFESLDVG